MTEGVVYFYGVILVVATGIQSFIFRVACLSFSVILGPCPGIQL